MMVKVEVRAIKIFLGTFLLSKAFCKVFPWWMYVGKDKRRLHHLETGLYLVAVGLGLILDDVRDLKAEVEFYDKNTDGKKTTQRSRYGLVFFKRREKVLDWA